jgi:cell division protein FtsB
MGVRSERGTREAGLRRKATALFSIIVFIALVVGAFFGDDGIFDLWREQGRSRALQEELDALRVENGRLAEESRRAPGPGAARPRASG